MRTVFTILIFISLPVFAQNPILPDFQADPSAHIWDGRVWVYPSHDLSGSTGWDMVDWHCFSSKNLKKWKDHGTIFSLEDISWAERKAYAPDIMKRHGIYYFYFPADYQIGVATSEKPDGPFRDALGKPLIERMENGVEAMDPTIFIDDDGSAWLYYGGHSTAGVVKLKDDMITREGEIIPLQLKGFSEGIWVHKYDGIYYFSYPMDISREGKINQLLVYSTASSPIGPFEYKGPILDNQSRNVHHSIIEIQNQYYLFYHIEGTSPYERRVCIEYLNHDEKGEIIPLKMTTIGVDPLKRKISNKIVK